MTKPSPSPLDKVRNRYARNNPKLNWDIEDGDPVLRHQIIKYVAGLIERTPANSRLAYYIANSMESDYLSLEGLSDVFPYKPKRSRTNQKQDNDQKWNMVAGREDAEEELKGLKELLKKQGKNPSADLVENIRLAEEQLENIQEDIEDFEDVTNPNERYPLSVKFHTTRKGVQPKDWEVLTKFMTKKAKAAPKGKTGSLITNAQMLADHLGLSEDEKAAMTLTVLMSHHMTFRGFISNISSNNQKAAYGIIARMLNIDRNKLSDIFSNTSALCAKGILVPVSDINDSSESAQIMPVVSHALLQTLSEPDMTVEKIITNLIGKPATTDLDWDKDFAYLGENGQELIDILKGAKQAGSKGVNLLLYGLPGTGKTEAAKAAAKKVGLDLYIVGEGRQFRSRSDRLSMATLAQELLSDNKNAAIMLDEMKDLFPAQMSLSELFGGAADGDDNREEPTGVSKVYLNRLLEDNKTITLWADNNPERFDPAFLRRILYSVNFRVPPAGVRVKFWERIMGRHEYELEPAQVKSLASSFVVPPGVISNAVVHAKLSGGGVPSIRRSMQAASCLMFGSRTAIQARDEVPGHYDLRFLNTQLEFSDLNLVTLAQNLKETRRRDFSMLLYGVPGTGKSEYLSYLASLLEMDVLKKDASSLTDKFVGESEKKIAAAFEEAADLNMFLLIDEGDTFMRDRRQLDNNYEISSVNIMLDRMQRHPMPFACTTNLFENIDPAAKRRFIFKIAFQVMTPEQAFMAYTHFFNRPCPPAIAQCPNLVASDFVNVCRQASFMAGDISDERYLRLLTLEAKARADTTSNLYGGSPKGAGFLSPAIR